MRFEITGNDIDKIDKEIEEFIRLCKEEVKKDRISKLISQKFPVFFNFLCIKYPEKVIFVVPVKLNRLMRITKRPQKKMIKKLKGYLEAKNVSFNSIKYIGD